VRVIVGGIGYRNLRDHSAGLAVTDRLAGRPWPAGVAVEDLSYNPIAVLQRLEDEPPGRGFERAVLVAAVQRGRPPGAVTVYRWDGGLPSGEGIQRAVADAVTGVIALDNTVVVAGHFGGWPPEVLVVEIEPRDHEFGEAFSDPVSAAIDEACRIATRLATDAAAAATVPRAPLGGSPPVPVG
jgi:hydrogenase maturation protease